MNKGTIIYHPKYRFQDSYTSPKYLIVLSSPPSSIPYLIVKTTSQKIDKPEHPGCHHFYSVFKIDHSKEWFPRDTWIQFHEIYHCFSNEIEDWFANYGAEIKGELSEQTFLELRECILTSRDITTYERMLLK